ncbi:uncharacterized protein N7459_009021 [Penicillium hispanicum]|uniref:uncharacterized protein n=1 Tax=Penicillium hispanicum TaxID=1080232 RepID=UPI0025404ABB|nr:uncharacterized protein N7459_009021 [Penicillium hispanicum]KAJ5569591.1 hypothetical protein N7459_009021 [Penicillium hispanicum]
MPPTLGSLIHSLSHNWLGKADIAVQTVLLAVCFAAVGLRLWSRRLQRVSLQGNDWFIVGATLSTNSPWVVIIGRYAVELVFVLLCGMGLHTMEVTRIGGLEAIVRFDKLTYAGDLLWITVVCLVQVSILHYYLRRFPVRIVMWLAYGMLALCSALWIASLLATAFLCTPPKKAWLADTDGHCRGRQKLRTGCAACGIILNVFILLVPVPALWHLRLARARRIAVGGIYILGIIIIVLSGVRIKVDLDLNPADPTYTSARTSLLTCMIPLVGIIAACLPLLPPAIQHLSGTMMFSPVADGPDPAPVSPRYWKTDAVSSAQVKEPEIPLVPGARTRMSTKWSELGFGQIKITSDWEIHSTRNSARLDKDSIRRG